MLIALIGGKITYFAVFYRFYPDYEAFFENTFLPAHPEAKHCIIPVFQPFFHPFLTGFTGYAGPFSAIIIRKRKISKRSAGIRVYR
jgi:hypothetical protein